MRTSLLTVAAALLAACVCCGSAAAQTTTASWTVMLSQGSGPAAPLPGALVDIYRTDIKAAYQIRADSNGRYIRSGLPFVGTYTLVFSAPGARTAIVSGCRFAAQPALNVVLDPGDGSRPSADQVRRAPARPCSEPPGTPEAAGPEGIARTPAVLAGPVPSDLASLFDAGRVDETISESRKALAVDPHDSEANLYLGLALFRQSDEARFEEAASHLARFLDRAPSAHPRAEAAKASLDDYRSRVPAPAAASPPKPSRRR